MGALAELFSGADTFKRRLKDMVSNPVPYAQQTADHVKNRLSSSQGALQMLTDSMNPMIGGVVTNRMMRGPGPAITARSFEKEDLPALQDLLARFGRAKALTPDQSSIFSQLMDHASEAPSVTTTVGIDRMGNPVSAYQAARKGVDSPYEDADYLAHILSLNGPKGAGSQALRDATFWSDSGKLKLYPTHDAKDFYEKTMAREKGWSKEPSEELGIERFVWDQPKDYRQGGLIKMKRCTCGH